MSNKIELHHKVPLFLGGTNYSWNIESISPKQHFINHLLIARELNTFASWASVISILNRNPDIGLFRKHWSQKMGYSQKGENGPNFGKLRTIESKNKTSNAMKGRQKGNENSQFKGYYISPNGDRFASLREASDNFNRPQSTILYWCKRNNNGWTFQSK